jgi:hypothetical protein
MQSGVVWLHRAVKLLNHDVSLKNEIDFISHIFDYYSVAHEKGETS